MASLPPCGEGSENCKGQNVRAYMGRRTSNKLVAKKNIQHVQSMHFLHTQQTLNNIRHNGRLSCKLSKVHEKSINTPCTITGEECCVCVSVLWGRSMDASMVQIFQHDVKDKKPSMHGHGKPSPSRNHSQLSNRAHRTRKYYKPMVRSTDQNKLSNKCKMETTA